MGNNYQLDIEKYSIKKLKKNLASREMIPSRTCLKEDLDERFKILETHSIKNLKDLIEIIKTESKVQRFSMETGLPVDYLILLKREAKSYLSNPVRIDAFTGIPKKYMGILETHGIKNSRQLFNEIKNKNERTRFAEKSGIPINILEELLCLSDLCRVYGVGPVFARMIYDLGIHSIKDFIEHTAEDFIQLYEEKTQHKADFGVNDIQFSLDLAKELDIAVKF